MRLVQYFSKDPEITLKFFELTLRPEFETGIKNLRKKWRIDKDFLDSRSQEAEEEYRRLSEDTNMVADITKFLSNLKLSIKWTDATQEYLLIGNLLTKNYMNDEGLILITDADDHSKDMILKVGPETTFADYRKAWDEIKKSKSRNKPNRKRNNFWRDYEIYKLVRNGKTTTQIAIHIECEFGDDLNFENIKKIYSQFCTRLNIPKNLRPSLKSGY